MSQWVNYWKIVSPASRKTSYTHPIVNMDDGMNLNSAGYASFSTVAWFSNLLKGATARLQRYKQYEAMDTGDVSRALDIVAEEISNPDKRTGLPFIIDYQTEENQEVYDTLATTLRAALRHWSKFHKLNRRIFNTARMMVKYGDCFFRKTSDTQQWEFIDCTRVIGIEVNAEGKKIAYHIRPSSFQNTVKGVSGGNTTNDGVEITPAEAVIHFTLSDDMGDTAPFGLSILQSAFKDWQKMIMLEDAAIIYRIVRAPERRVFYIDVGNMAPQRVKQHLEGIRNDIRQKRQPNTANSGQTDTAYNAESIQEDYFLPTTAAGRGSRIETLPGGATWEIPELDYFLNKVFRALRVPTSYMKGQDATGAQVNDGKVGIAYIEELRFANYIQRLQSSIEEVYDEQFKIYLQVTGINVDNELFNLRLPEPQNFALYRQAALDADLINGFNAIEGVKYLSRRFILRRYLGLTEDEIQMNESLIKQEREIIDQKDVNEIQQIYDPAVYDNRSTVDVAGPQGGMGMDRSLETGSIGAGPGTDVNLGMEPPPGDASAAGGAPPSSSAPATP
jgi:hypothetical protein